MLLSAFLAFILGFLACKSNNERVLGVLSQVRRALLSFEFLRLEALVKHRVMCVAGCVGNDTAEAYTGR